MDNLDPKAVKLMLASLQRQRNSSNDRIVDLETALAIKEDQLKEMNEQFTAEIANANETVQVLRQLHEKIVNKNNLYANILNAIKDLDLTNAPFVLTYEDETFSLSVKGSDSYTVEDQSLNTDNRFEDMPENPHSEVQATTVVVEDLNSTSTFEDAPVTRKDLQNKKFFGKHR